MKRLPSLERLSRLRALLKVNRLQAYILASEDEHFNEYVDPADRCYTFLSGFTGSTCTLLVTMDRASLWTDSRYILQASQEVDENWSCNLLHHQNSCPSKWLVDCTPAGAKIGYDGRQMPYTEIQNYIKEITSFESVKVNPNIVNGENSSSRQLVDFPSTNLVGSVWDSMVAEDPSRIVRPHRNANPLLILPISFTGSTWQEKLLRVRESMKETGSNLFVTSSLDEIAWLFNLRGSDICYNPLFFSHLIIGMDCVDLFLNSTNVSKTPELKKYLNDPDNKIQIHPYSDFFQVLEDTTKSSSTFLSSRVLLDFTASHAVVDRVPEPNRLIQISPIASMKCVKSQTEIDGIIQAHVVDSLILCDFLAWLDEVATLNTGSNNQVLKCDPNDGAGLPSLKAPEYLTESSTARYLDSLRAQAKNFLSLSFATISAADSNGAIIHYHATEDEDAPLTNSTMYLIDSGSHYLTGTTDVTRTIHLGDPSLEHKNIYTLVLKAHISLANQIFPSNTAGSLLDVVARKVMWSYSGDYGHGTGHGVGACLSVHEGPIGFSGRRLKNYCRLGICEPGIKENMVVTIEPGFYWTNHFGIRLENVYITSLADHTKQLFSLSNYCDEKHHRNWIGFVPATLVPFQRKLINPSLLSTDELRWLNDYHAQVCQTLVQYMSNESSGLNNCSPSRKRCHSWILSQTEPMHFGAVS